MNNTEELDDLIARTAQARAAHLNIGTWLSWFIYQEYYLALGRRALRSGHPEPVCPVALQAMQQPALDIH